MTLSSIKGWAIAMALTAVVSASFFAGSHVRGLHADRDISALKETHRAEIDAANAAADQRIAELEAKVAEASKKLVAKTAKRRVASQTVQKEISDARASIRTVLPAGGMPSLWVRLYDRALLAGDQGGDADPGSGLAATAGGTADAGSGVSEWQVLTVHGINAERWGDCRDRYNALIDALGGKQ
jgi:hypothetical protein